MNAFVAIVIGLVVPLFISWLKNKRWPRNAKLLFALAVSVGIAALQVLGEALVDGTLDLANWPGLAAIVFTTATVVYRLYFEETDLNQALEAKRVLP